MGKIITPIPIIEVIHESVPEIEDVFSLEREQVDMMPRFAGLASAGYDDEIGLWEELLHRYNSKQAEK